MAMFRLTVRDGLELRLLEEDHAEAAFALVEENRAMLSEWLSWVETTRSAGDTRAFIRGELGKFRANRGLTAGLWSDGALAGVVGVHEPSWLNRKTSLGYWLGAAYQGQGRMTAAVGAIVDLLFREWKLHRVEIHVAVDNHRSAAIPIRLGFVEEALLREAIWANGRFHDSRLFAQLAPPSAL